MNQALPRNRAPRRPKAIQAAPIPAALLALTAVVCMGTIVQAGPAQPFAVQQACQAALADREGLGQLLAAITQATRNPHQRPAAHAEPQGLGPHKVPAPAPIDRLTAAPVSTPPAPLRDTLINLPPPAMR